ncbi:MAG: prolyl oligopeptidase family serine peptidase [Thermodesulfobacteriota bacterium]
MPRPSKVLEERLTLHSEGLRLAVFAARPADRAGRLPAVEIHHGGGGYDTFYEDLAILLAERGFVGVAMAHRGNPGSEGRTEYGRGEVADIGHLSEELCRRADVDPGRLGIVGYSRGAHSALLALERFDFFRAAVLWSPPVEMERHVRLHPWIAQLIGATPEEAPEQYALRSPLPRAGEIRCPLLILHGEEDDVVPPEHSLLLARELERTHRPFELELLPGEGHTWSAAGFAAVWGRTVSFLEHHLLPRR